MGLLTRIPRIVVVIVPLFGNVKGVAKTESILEWLFEFGLAREKF
jgi:hypothetical protein